MASEQANGTLEPPGVWIRDLIRQTGPITFARLMEAALYHPEWGYYTQGPRIGPKGDFTTSPEASPAFGQAMTNHVIEVDALLGRPEEFSLVECGPGLGTLARNLLLAVSKSDPGLSRRLHYTLVEISPALAARQRELLLPAYEGKVGWVTGLSQLESGKSGAVLANEVVDAFPVNIVENRAGQICEQYVTLDKNDQLTATFGPLSTQRLADFLTEWSINLQPGERIEVNLAVEDWLAQMARVLAHGVATIIDYGDTQPGRYSQSRREGTLLGYYGGAVTDNALARPGRQDLTALVDFTAVEAAAAQAGFRRLGITRQANFLLGLGLGTTITPESMGGDLQQVIENRRGVQELISPDGLGQFHVLLLARGLDASDIAPRLSALKYLNV